MMRNGTLLIYRHGVGPIGGILLKLCLVILALRATNLQIVMNLVTQQMATRSRWYYILQARRNAT